MRKHSRCVPAEVSPSKHLVCGPGGTKAYLSGAGAIAAFDFAGLKSFKTIGGVSGGSIPSLLLAAGVDPAKIVRDSIELDFSKLLVQTDTLGNALKHRLPRRDRRNGKRIRDGLVSSHGLGRLLEQVVPEWPENYWTMAVAGKAQILFTADGVYEFVNGRKRLISRTPAPVGLAIRASCAVPGIIEAVEFQGRHLFDGALGKLGHCPTGMVQWHFGATTGDIIAVDLLRTIPTRKDRVLLFIGRTISGTVRQRPTREGDEVEAGLLVQPEVTEFGSLEFDITVEQKQAAVLAGFRSAVHQLAEQGILSGERLMQAQLACESFDDFSRLYLCQTSEPATVPRRSLVQRLLGIVRSVRAKHGSRQS
jgi:predicted acylesterase/phospholipase RssA